MKFILIQETDKVISIHKIISDKKYLSLFYKTNRWYKHLFYGNISEYFTIINPRFYIISYIYIL